LTTTQEATHVPENESFPSLIYANLSPKSVGGQSIFETTEPVTASSVKAYESEQSATDRAVEALRQAGFQILDVSAISINIAGTREQYEEFFNTQLVTQEAEVLKPGQRADTATFIDTTDNDVPGYLDTSRSPLADVLEGGAIETPRYTMQSAVPPNPGYWHLDVPNDVSELLEADKAHQDGFDGTGTHVVMIDSGWFAHPWFAANGFAGEVVLAPGTTDPTVDDNGHGTGESANVFSIAPATAFRMVKWNFVNSTAAINTAATLDPRPDVISCSWGSSVQNGPLTPTDQLAAAAIANAVDNGIIVVFSAGNGQWGFPGQHPDVISAGGVFVDDQGNMQAANYASGFASNVFQGRSVPDVCGLVGMLPQAAYLMLPIPPGSEIDVRRSGNAFPDKDETTSSDGWSAFSGTSAAAPQVAGACALLRQANPQISAAAAREALMTTAIDIVVGSCHPATGGNAAAVGPDLATGAGLMSVSAAVSSVAQ
jgi:subtilisin family serine protease